MNPTSNSARDPIRKFFEAANFPVHFVKLCREKCWEKPESSSWVTLEEGFANLEIPTFSSYIKITRSSTDMELTTAKTEILP